MTVIQSKFDRGLYFNAALAFVPDILVSWAFAAYNNGGWPDFFFALVALQAIYLAIWIKNSAWSWLVFWVSGRKYMANHIEDYLTEHRFPPPPQYLSGADDYLSGVANDESVDCAMRVKAAQEVGTLSGIAAARRFQLGLQLRMAMEDAIQRYSRKAKSPEPAKESARGDEVTLSMTRNELDGIAWLADYGFRLFTAKADTYRRSFEQLPYQRAAAYASLLDKFERKSVPELLLEDEEDKERRFNNHENRMKTLWACYPHEG